jgi:uncharacterized protein YndB with AHSA1/START domain
MRNNLIAKATTTINAPCAAVWHALTDPESVKRYMFGAWLTTSWAEGTPIYWSGEFNGKAYEDKGIVLGFDPPRCLEFSHYTPRSGLPDIPTSYHTVTIKLEERGDETHLSLQQDNNPSEDAREHAQKNWQMMLKGLKEFVEQQMRDSPIELAAIATRESRNEQGVSTNGPVR